MGRFDGICPLGTTADLLPNTVPAVRGTPKLGDSLITFALP
jgi:hypothetical protein